MPLFRAAHDACGLFTSARNLNSQHMGLQQARMQGQCANMLAALQRD